MNEIYWITVLGSLQNSILRKVKIVLFSKKYL